MMSMKKIILSFLLLFGLVITQTGVLAAEEAAQNEGWQFGVDIYMWGASIGGDSASGTEVDIDFEDLFKNLNLAFMGTAGARKGKWSFMLDAIYLDVQDDDTVAPGVKADVELFNWIVTPTIGYNLFETEKVRLDVLGGARYLWLKSRLDLTGYPKISESGHVWDGIAGVKGQVNLTDKWYIPFYGDIGTGDSELTWQAFAGIAYKFKKVHVTLAYRYLYWEFDDNDVFDDLNLSGPYAGVRFLF
jgi:hypothetical protein